MLVRLASLPLALAARTRTFSARSRTSSGSACDTRWPTPVSRSLVPSVASWEDLALDLSNRSFILDPQSCKPLAILFRASPSPPSCCCGAGVFLSMVSIISPALLSIFAVASSSAWAPNARVRRSAPMPPVFWPSSSSSPAPAPRPPKRPPKSPGRCDCTRTVASSRHPAARVGIRQPPHAAVRINARGAMAHRRLGGGSRMQLRAEREG
mmetsp:Transcript_80127/g.248676  ORF Transcript_80127/g.248676 Transcript_80127/m.248676 type:complete len:210 (-) Transcript_80127:24-653(-)